MGLNLLAIVYRWELAGPVIPQWGAAAVDAPDNTPVFPNATIYVPGNEFKFWMDSSIFTKLPEKQHGLPKRLQAMFPLLKDKVKQYEWDTEVIPGIHSIAAPGHTPGHTAFVVGSGKEQLMC